jgi:iron complex transport system substrate-binding protein
VSTTIRICSLLPSTTEIVCALGLKENLVGITHECDYPQEISEIQVVTKSLINHSGSNSHEINKHIAEALHSGSGIYSIDNEALEFTNPDLILTQELCEVCAVSYSQVEESVRTLSGHQTVLSFEPSNIEGILDSIIQIGKQTCTEANAKALVSKAHGRIDVVRSKSSDSPKKPSVLGLEWLEPPFIGGHWVPEMIEIAGGSPALGDQAEPSREITWEQALEASPQIIVLMVCGFDLERTMEEFSLLNGSNFWKKYNGEIYAVNGSAYFSRPGPRIIDGIEILSEIIHPNIFQRKTEPNAWMKVN